MALAASRTLLALFVTFCAPSCGWTAGKPLRTQSGKQTLTDKSPRDSWETPIHLDGRPVDRFVISHNKPSRSHRFTKTSKDVRAPLLEDVDPEWVNLDGFAVLGGSPVSNTSAGPIRFPHTAARTQPSVKRATRDDRTARPSSVSNMRTHRRAPQSSSGPRQPERPVAGMSLLDRRRQRHTKPQSDQRNRNTAKLTSESVHVVSLQAQTAQGMSAPANRAVAPKTTTPEPEPEYEARDISVRVMSPQSVLISWVDPLIELGKVDPEEDRSYTVRYREKGESARWEYKDSTQRRMMIETLTADSMYEFSVRISQDEKQGKWSVSVFQRTPESAPSGPPENFEVKPLRGKGTAVIATWDPPDQPNGRIREYILSYAPALKPFGMKSVTYRSSTSTATVDGLTPGDTYIFKIKATNRRGQGPQSKALSVTMPGSSGSKPKIMHRTSHTSSTQDTDLDEPEPLTTEAPVEPTTPSQSPANKRHRPLSKSRSYHSIFSSVRGSSRNSRGFSRGRVQNREDEDEEKEAEATTPPPVEETTTSVMEPEEREPDNDVSPEVVEEELQTTETPNLKLLTPSPTKQTYGKPRRPIKIRVHKKSSAKSDSFFPSSSDTSSSHYFFVSSTSSSHSPSSTSTSSPPLVEESAARREDYTASTYNKNKDLVDKETLSYNKPEKAEKENDSQQPEVAPSSRGAGGRVGGFGYGSRNGRRRPGVLLRGNSTRMLNGYKPGPNPQSNVPSRTANSATFNSHTSSVSQISVPERTNKETSETNNGHRPQTSSQSRSHSSVPVTSQSTTHHPFRPTTSRETPRTLSQVGRTSTRENGDGKSERTYTELINIEEPTVTSKLQPTEEEGKGEEEEIEEPTEVKPVVSRTRNSPSLVERFPWLANRYPGRYGSRTRTLASRQDGRSPLTRNSSSVGVFRPILRGTAGRVSGATGASGVSLIQETSEDLNTPSNGDSLKSGVGVGGVKPSLVDKDPASSETRKTTTSASPSLASTSRGQTGSSERIHKDPNYDNHNTHKKDYVDSGENDEHPVITAASANRNMEDNESVNTRATSSGTRTGTSAGVPPNHRRPAVGTSPRVHSPFLANRQFGRPRVPIRLPNQLGQNTRSTSSTSSVDSSSSNVPQSVLTSHNEAGPETSERGTVPEGHSHSTSSSSSSTALSSRDTTRGTGVRSRYPVHRGKPINGGAVKPANGNGKNGRPNLTATSDKDSPASPETSKAVGRKFITGPDGSKWVVDLERGILMNQAGQILQDSSGKPKRVVLGEDGRTIFDHRGSPLLNQEGMALFGHGRDSRPVINPKEKILTVGGKPLLGLDVINRRTSTTTTTTTTVATTTPVPTTMGWTTTMPYPTCPPGTYAKIDEYGFPLLDQEGILDCYPEAEESSGLDTDYMVTVTMVPDALALNKDELFTDTTTLPPSTTIPSSTPPPRPSNRGPLSEYDLSGKKRFTAPYVNYIQKDPGAPCSLTEALEYLQVDILEGLMNKDNAMANQNLPPKNKPKNVTVVAMEGCHSFIILDWARPLAGDMVSGYMVHSASYDDVLNNRWSSRISIGTHLPVENLKPNSRYYFKVQAKNVFGLGPVSDTLTYVTESDDPLLIERPPGGEPIWIPFTFKYNPAHSSCKGSQFVKRTWYRKFVGVVLCNSLRYKIFMGDGLREPFYSIGDTFGHGEDHCQFVDSYRDGRTGPEFLSNYLPSAQGYYRAYRQEPVTFGVIGRRTSHPFVGWYECGVPIPGKW